MNIELILVDDYDKEIGIMEKHEAHEKGLLHRAVSVFIFNSDGKLLLQKRALEKYHSPGLWTNTACGHPFPKETIFVAANRKLKEEMGIDCNLTYAFKFKYRVDFENGLSENEIDHVFIGRCDSDPKPDTNEVMDWKWFTEFEISSILKNSPSSLTEWFKICYPEVLKCNNKL